MSPSATASRRPGLDFYGIGSANVAFWDSEDVEIKDLLIGKATAGKGKVEIYGVPPSANCMGPVMLAKQAGCGDITHCMPGEGTRTPEFLR